MFWLDGIGFRACFVPSGGVRKARWVFGKKVNT